MRRSGVLASASLLMALVGCATVEPLEAIPVGRDYRPASACSASSKVPQIVKTNPATFTDAIWNSNAVWESQMGFEVDDEGVPHDVRAVVRDVGVDRDVLERSATAALEGYRFCPHAGLSPSAHWAARMRFTPSPVASEVGGGQMVVQLFLPAYTRDDVSARRSGRNEVQATFGQDGRPLTVRLAITSGDPVLDRKSLEAIAGYQLVFRPGTVLTHPLTFQQPYKYEIR